MINFLNLEYFLVAAEELNFTRAAKKLFISQQSLSNHISNLEKEFDVVLFNRTSPLTLTYAGLVTGSGAVLIALVYFYTRYVTLSIAFDPPQQIPLIDATTPQAAKVDTNLFDLLSSIMRSAVGALALLVVLSGTVG